MIKNAMKAKILQIITEDEAGGEVLFSINNKEVRCIVHECGELDWEGPTMSDEEFDCVMETFNTSDEINNAFSFAHE